MNNSEKLIRMFVSETLRIIYLGNQDTEGVLEGREIIYVFSPQVTDYFMHGTSES